MTPEDDLWLPHVYTYACVPAQTYVHAHAHTHGGAEREREYGLNNTT